MLKLVTVAIDAGTIGLVGECLSGDIDMDLSNSIARRVEVYGITRKDGIDFHIDGCKRAGLCAVLRQSALHTQEYRRY
jgi:hypothetical protein